MRGFTETEIQELGFRSTPLSGTESLARKLLREGYSLSGIPGFFVNRQQNWDAAFYKKNRGFLCPAYDLSGRISGFQIRLDVPYDDRRVPLVQQYQPKPWDRKRKSDYVFRKSQIKSDWGDGRNLKSRGRLCHVRLFLSRRAWCESVQGIRKSPSDLKGKRSGRSPGILRYG